MSRTPYALALAIFVPLGAIVQAASFDSVVSLGDSLQDQILHYRGPLVSEHLADRLDAPLTELARVGSTTAGLIRQGQHTEAAAQFGAGDLATLWIGGNDFFLSSLNPFGVGIGNFRFLDRMVENVDTILGTLRGAGMDVLVFNLPDMSAPPLSQLLSFSTRGGQNIAEATVEWNSRLGDLASQHGAHLVDVYSYFEELSAHPENYTILGEELVFDRVGCELCIFADPVHPSSVAQGLIANLAIDVLNEAFPEGPQLTRLTESELAELAGITPFGNLLVRWQEAFGRNSAGDLDGDGDTDGRDFLAWQRGAGTSVVSSNLAAVPEPTTALVAAAALLVFTATRRGGR